MFRLQISDEERGSLPLGATLDASGCWFAVWAPAASQIIIHLYTADERKLGAFPLTARSGGVWYGFRPGVTAGQCYAVEAVGIESRMLLDPYAKALNKSCLYAEQDYVKSNEHFIPKALIVDPHDDFDWQGTHRLELDPSRIIIYEAHVRGMTMLCPKVRPELRGTYLGFCSPFILDYLQDLGITAVQFMPLTASMSEPYLTERGLSNYWGYNPVCFMAPEPRYAHHPLQAVREFKTMVRELHKRGIAVIMDVVFNHTAEGGAGGPVLSFKGLDKNGYYAFNDEACTHYTDVSGCGNSFSADSFIGIDLVHSAMRHWLEDMQVDGFRFDLGVTVNRESHGTQRFAFERNSAFMKMCFSDHIISRSLLIAEPWDLGGDGYQLGSFGKNWCEMNDKFRDTVRRFWRGDPGFIGEFATRLMGSRDIFKKGERSIKSSVNYVTYHDGFTLEDLVSYSSKHNEQNGEDNRDGSSFNFSSNSGVEGPTCDQVIKDRRSQLKRNLLATLLIAQGTPHILFGDERGRTQLGNNNAYCQDNHLSYLDWNLNQEQRELHDFLKRLIALRGSVSFMRELKLADDRYYLPDDLCTITWLTPSGLPMQAEDWQRPQQHTFMLFAHSQEQDEYWCIIFNQGQDKVHYLLPSLPSSRLWMRVIDTSSPDGLPAHPETESTVDVAGCSILILKAVTEADEQSPAGDTVRHANRDDPDHTYGHH